MAIEYEKTDRGFKHYDPIKTSYGHIIKVYESSAAMEPHIWLSVEQTEESAREAGSNIEPEEAIAHLTVLQAKLLRKALKHAIKNHYHYS